MFVLAQTKIEIDNAAMHVKVLENTKVVVEGIKTTDMYGLWWVERPLNERKSAFDSQNSLLNSSLQEPRNARDTCPSPRGQRDTCPSQTGAKQASRMTMILTPNRSKRRTPGKQSAGARVLFLVTFVMKFLSELARVSRAPF